MVKDSKMDALRALRERRVAKRDFLPPRKIGEEVIEALKEVVDHAAGKPTGVVETVVEVGGDEVARALAYYRKHRERQRRARARRKKGS